MRIGSPPGDCTSIIDPLESSEWDRIIGSRPEHSFFHSSNWAAVLKESYSYTPRYFALSGASALSALIPVMEVASPFTGKRGVSLPFTDYCEPLVSDKTQFARLLGEVLLFGSEAGWKYLEFRGGAKYFDGAVPYGTYLRHVLEINGRGPVLFHQIRASNRRNIRKATRSGVRVVISRSESDLADYYRLHCLTRKRHGLPPQPRSFFDAVYRNVISKGRGFTALGVWQGGAVSGAVYFYSGKKAIYKYGASDMRYQHLRAANLVMWEAIRWFCENGFEELCLGRTDRADAGLVRFKRGWGAREEVLDYFRYDLKNSIFVRDAPKMNISVTPLLKHLPISILRLAGTLLYRHMA
ncbi:MAG: GNAT family N-acetyltransferase [Syntrophobacteraceae bacterium]